MMWDEGRPVIGDQIADFGVVVRSQRSELNNALQKHFYFGDSVSSAGIPRLGEGSAATGACRAYFDSAISVEHVGTLFVTSDTSRLVVAGSSNSVVVGSRRAIVAGPPVGAIVSSTISAPGNFVTTRVQSDQTTVGVGDGSANISFPVAYNGVPQVMITGRYPNDTSNAILGLSTVTQGGITVAVDNTVGGNVAIWWRSVGTVSL